MPGRLLDNGREASFNYEYVAGPNGDIQVVAERELVPISVAAAGDRRFQVTSGAVISLQADKSLPAGANRAQLALEGSAAAAGLIRWMDEAGTPPATNHGALLRAPTGDSVYLWIHGRQRLLNFKMIRADLSTIDPFVQMFYYE